MITQVCSIFNLPDEIMMHILHFAPDIAVGRMRRVHPALKELIDSNARFTCRLIRSASIVAAQRLLPSVEQESSRSLATREVAVAYAPFDVDCSLQAARTMNQKWRSSILTKIILKLGKYNLPAAIKLAESLGSNFHADIVQLLAPVDLDAARTLAVSIENESFRSQAVRKVITILALSDAPAAKELLSSIPNVMVRSAATISIATAQAQTDIQDAVITALAIDRNYDKCGALVKIATVAFQKKEPLDTVRHLVLQAKNVLPFIDDYALRNDSQCDIAALEAHYDVEAACATAAATESENWREAALAQITCVLAKTDREKASEMASTLREHHRSIAFLKIIKATAKTDPKAAMDLSLSLNHQDYRYQGLVIVIKAVAKKSFPDAQAMTTMVDNPFQKVMAHLAIAEVSQSKIDSRTR